ncbi:thioredoxin-like protein, partial [Gaertneriomyces semiglobifer]
KMAARVTLYYSSVSGALMVKKQQSRVQDIFAARKIQFDLVDVAADEEAKEFMQRKSGKNTLPQIFVDGEYKGVR